MSEFINSFKSKKEDFASPFMSSIIISWIVINHKYLLICFETGKINEKLMALKVDYFSEKFFNFEIPIFWNMIVPVSIGFVYVIIYPRLSHWLYKQTMENKVIKEKIKYDKYEKALHKDKLELQEKIIGKDQKIN